MAIAVPPESAGSVPPHNEEAEASVLGAILLTEQALDGVLLEIGLRPEHFYRPRHQRIFEAMIRLKEKAEPEAVDALTVCDDLRSQGVLEEAGGEAYVHSLPTVVPAVGAVLDYARIVRDDALMRGILDTTRRIQAEVLAHRGEPRDLIERAEAELFKIGHEGGMAEMRTIEAVLHEEIDKLEELSRKDIGLTGTPSGFGDIDELTGGFQPGNLIVLAARPSMGKCLTGSSIVYDPTTGERPMMREVVEAVERGEDRWIVALDREFRLVPARVSHAHRNGTQPVFHVTTKLGRRITATSNHPLLTAHGWRPLESLTAGARIAVPRAMPEPSTHESMPDHELVLLAAMIADGSFTGTTPRFCYGKDSPMRGEVELAASKMGLRFRDSGGHGTASISAGRGSPSNRLTELLQQHGLRGRRSADKFVPSAIFRWHVGTRGLSRPLLREIAVGIAEPYLFNLATSDVWWDEISSIEPAGHEETFDLTVPDHHNFVADDVVVHNSTLATNIAENAAIEHGRPVALFSLEMSETELAHRFIASQASVSSDELRKGRVKADRWPKVLRAVEKLAAAPIFIDDSSDIGVLEMRAKARRLHARHAGEGGLGLIVVDYLQLVRPDGRTDSRVEQVGQISRGLKILARELDIPVVAVSQLSRAVESRHPPIPMLSDLRESGQVEQDADVVMFVYREEYYDKESERLGEADIIFAKHRNGPVGQVTLTFLPRHPKFMGHRPDYDRIAPVPPDLNGGG